MLRRCALPPLLLCIPTLAWAAPPFRPTAPRAGCEETSSKPDGANDLYVAFAEMMGATPDFIAKHKDEIDFLPVADLPGGSKGKKARPPRGTNPGP